MIAWSLPAAVIVCILLGLLILATIVGNLFVMAAILLDKHLQSVANYLILSLSVTDLLVACLVMPLGAVYEVTREWILGPELCDMWTISDVLCCTASILHLVAIALDRYWAVTNVHYMRQRSSTLILTMIVLIWSMAALVSFAPLLGWKDSDWATRILENKVCMVSQDIGYQVFATLCTFYIPLCVVLYLYWRIFNTARKRIRRKINPTRAQLPTPSTYAATTTTTATQPSSERSILPDTVNTLKDQTDVTAKSSVVEYEINQDSSSFCMEAPSFVINESSSPIAAGANGVFQMTFTLVESAPSAACRKEEGRKLCKARKKILDNKREKKAAKTLAIITGAFVVCWLPFFVMALLVPLCTNCFKSRFITSFFLWLGYFNSTVNPVIYTVFNPEFRNAFQKMLCRGRQAETNARVRRTLQ